METLLAVDALSDMLRVSKSTVYRWVHYGFIPYLKIGGAVRFDERAVRKWLQSRETPGRQRISPDVE